MVLTVHPGEKYVQCRRCCKVAGFILPTQAFTHLAEGFKHGLGGVHSSSYFFTQETP